jgi:hypothetical protein
MVQNPATARWLSHLFLRRDFTRFAMKKRSWIAMALLAAGCIATAHAQLIGSVSVSPATVKAGEPVTVTANVDVLKSNYCGFAVFYGDGKNIESFSDINKPTPFVTTHVYDKPGTYTVSMGGRHVESHPNCGGGDKFATVTVTPGAAMAAAPVAAAKPSAASVCQAPWKLAAKSFNAKTGAYTCAAKAGSTLPAPKPECPGDLTYFENMKKGQFGCKP